MRTRHRDRQYRRAAEALRPEDIAGCIPQIRALLHASPLIQGDVPLHCNIKNCLPAETRRVEDTYRESRHSAGVIPEARFI
jgi:hypothetical protein